MNTEINDLKNTPLNERQLLLQIASKNKQQAVEAFQEFCRRHNDRLYEFCQGQTADYTEDIEKKLAKSLYGSLLIYIFDHPETLLEVIKGKRSSLGMQAAIFSYLDSVILPELFKEFLNEKWLEKDHYEWLPPIAIKRITDQNAFQEYTNLKHELPELHQDDAALKKELKLFGKIFKKLKPKDQKFLLMMAEPIKYKGKQFPEIIAAVCKEFGMKQDNVRQRSLRLINRLKADYNKIKKKK